ncbi:AMIN-like domain-containing (lipo)protein [Candidatus Blastococcus massiliensis]|uniref:AMIN-like domain-containing (lipo)protein n=1 Tax=Candidatus Blastococcus massiliensis TaxID=1470358 RepID=UPI0004B20693|nr:hypothetical protein [Candidatus Blastococcus massiliensis]
MRLLAAGACAVLALTACGTSGDPPGQPRDTGAATATSSATADPAEDRPARPIATGDVVESQADADGPPVVLTDVRLGAHEGFDRIVFELAGEGRAGWQVGYTGAPRSQGSGEPVEVPGHAVLGITLTNLAMPGDAPSGVRPWSGPDSQEPDGGAVLEALVSDNLFEGRYAFFAGLAEQRQFAVGLLTDPQRIVVDLLDEPPTSSTPLSLRCESPAGFAISYPEGWSVNVGETVPACTRFAPESFRVPPATDARIGSVTASVQTMPFDLVASTGAAPDSRQETTIDGRRAVRIQQVTLGEGLYPPGIRITSYVVQLEPTDDGPRTLVVDTVGLPQFDYARNVRMLDRMMGTIEITG